MRAVVITVGAMLVAVGFGLASFHLVSDWASGGLVIAGSLAIARTA